MIELSPDNDAKNRYEVEESFEARNIKIKRHESVLEMAEPHEIKDDVYQ
jgi:hypothetical protein